MDSKSASCVSTALGRLFALIRWDAFSRGFEFCNEALKGSKSLIDASTAISGIIIMINGPNHIMSALGSAIL